jgi:activator of HSP90 ATPase
VADRPASAADREALLRRARFSTYRGPVTNISRRTVLGAPPHEVYRCLVDPTRHSALVGQPAEPGEVPGDHVTLAGGRLTGLLTEVLEDRHVVFALQYPAGPTEWPRHHYSTTTFLLRAEGDGTSLVLFAQGVPEELAGELASVWQVEYLSRLAAAFPADEPAGG